VQSLRQKYFTSDTGCKLNISLLIAALDFSKRNKGRVFTIINITKPFDTIPHAAIKPSLAWKGALTPVIKLILEMYRDSFTTIQAKNKEEAKEESNKVTLYHRFYSIYVWSRYWTKLRKTALA
jgi:hypothetical protein